MPMKSGNTISNKPQILVIDDDNVTRLTLKKTLLKQGYHVEDADSGEAGLALLDHYSPQLILLDVMMPGINGFEACQQIRKQFSYDEVQIIMLTGLNDIESVDEAFDVGANDFITKPINWPLLVKRVRYAIRDRERQIELAESESRLRKSLRIAKLAYWQLDMPTQKIYLSDVFYEQFYNSSIKIENFDQYISVVHKEDKNLLHNKLTELCNTKTEIELDHRIIINHHEYIFHLNAEAVLDRTGEITTLRGTVQNVTQQRNADALIKHQALHDALTGLPNKKKFTSELTRLLNRYKEETYMTAIVAIGLKRFNEIRDSLGHQSTDKLLKSFASRLSSLSYIQVAGHYESETFIIIINNLYEYEQLDSQLDSILQHLLSPYLINEQEIFVDIRIGISIFPIEEDSADILISNALLALTNARESINDKICFHSPEMNKLALRTRNIETQLRHAMSHDQLHLFYQPQIRLDSKELIGAEALIRLKLNQDDWMSPLDFIPIAEETGLIIPIGYWIIETACKQIRSWIDNNMTDLRIGINLSAKQFNDPELSNKLNSAVEKYGVPSHCIDLEITEGIALHDIDQTINVLQRFKQCGYTISIDDFGTGYSSLSSIHLLPIDILKIDRAFIKDIGHNGEHGTLAKTIINMAHNLNLSVIAEGAETDDHIKFLKEHHCNEVQGFYYSRPLPAEQFFEYCRRYRNNNDRGGKSNQLASGQ